MSYTFEDVASAMVLIEREGYRVYRLLIHPADKGVLLEMHSFVDEVRQDNFDGVRLCGTIWGMGVYASVEIPEGTFDLLPYPGKTLKLLRLLDERVCTAEPFIIRERFSLRRYVRGLLHRGFRMIRGGRGFEWVGAFR